MGILDSPKETLAVTSGQPLNVKGAVKFQMKDLHLSHKLNALAPIQSIKKKK
jgi:hypothetical protein